MIQGFSLRTSSCGANETGTPRTSPMCSAAGRATAAPRLQQRTCSRNEAGDPSSQEEGAPPQALMSFGTYNQRLISVRNRTGASLLRPAAQKFPKIAVVRYIAGCRRDLPATNRRRGPHNSSGCSKERLCHARSLARDRSRILVPRRGRGSGRAAGREGALSCSPIIRRSRCSRARRPTFRSSCRTTGVAPERLQLSVSRRAARLDRDAARRRPAGRGRDAGDRRRR